MHTAKPSREIRELTLLFEISKKLSESLDLESVLRPILQLMAEHLEMVRGTLTVLNRKSGEIAIEEAYGLEPEEKAKGKYRVGEGITGKVIDSGEPAIIPRISDEPLFLDRTGSRKSQNKDDIAFICVPIKMGSEVIGALSVDRLFSKKISLEEDVRLLTIIAATISQAARLRQLAEEELDKIKGENQRLQGELQNRYRPETIVGNSNAMRDLYALIDQVCHTNTTVLILGESGVGKERVAHAIHYNSNRAGSPFIKINCAALPESLIESELFGHEKGAFTGAAAGRKGRFEMADRGTIFLDEIGDLPPVVQTKLLRVLQEKEIERLGGNTTIRVDVRIITATNRNLESLIREGKLREDLYYRLNVFPIVVPPLRERKTDIMLLANYFIEKYTKEHGKKVSRITTSATDSLMNYHWPGNVRELENCMERAVILSVDGIIHSYHLPPNLQNSVTGSGSRATSAPGALTAMVGGMEKEIIVEALKRCRGNMAGAARELGITERVMGLRVAKFGISPSQFK
jgi:Nif-specific regulatory protein